MPQNSKIEKKFLLLMGAIIVLFLLVWFFSARSFTGWGDEITHFSTAKGLVETGEYRTWAFDKGYANPYLYTRGLVITYLASIVYKISGLSLLAFRVIPLVFVMLTFLTFALYIRFRHRATAKALVYAAIFFFGQAFIFEQSVYVRVYAPLGWFMVMTLILFWESAVAFGKRNLVSGVWFLVGSLFLLILPAADHWQVSHIAIYFLGFLLTWPVFLNIFLKFDDRFSIRVKIFWIGSIILLAPFLVFFLDLSMAHLIMNTKKLVLGRNYVTYWDNLVGLVRYVLALNVCFLGLHWAMQILRKNKRLDFYSWLFYTGIISGILIGLFNPHNHIFYSRFFYVSVVLAGLGFSQMLLRLQLSKIAMRWVLGIFILLNTSLFGVNVYYERSNIRIAISWLEENLKQDDVLLVFASQLELHGGKSLLPRTYSVAPSQDPTEITKLLERLETSLANEIYFLYTDEYQFRDYLYLLTVGEDRSAPNDLFRQLQEVVFSKPVISGLRSCNLVRYKKADLVAALQKLLQEGYPSQFKAPEKRILKKIFKLR